MSFNLDLKKQAQKKKSFSRKLKKVCNPALRFKNNTVSQVSSQKYLGLTLDNKLAFDKHLSIYVPRKFFLKAKDVYICP